MLNEFNQPQQWLINTYKCPLNNRWEFTSIFGNKADWWFLNWQRGPLWLKMGFEGSWQLLYIKQTYTHCVNTPWSFNTLSLSLSLSLSVEGIDEPSSTLFVESNYGYPGLDSDMCCRRRQRESNQQIKLLSCQVIPLVGSVWSYTLWHASILVCPTHKPWLPMVLFLWRWQRLSEHNRPPSQRLNGKQWASSLSPSQCFSGFVSLSVLRTGFPVMNTWQDQARRHHE